jgi:hypothetical protein
MCPVARKLLMTGHVFIVIHSTESVEWYHVAIEDQSEAEIEVRKSVGQDVKVDSRPLPSQVLEARDMKVGEVKKWEVGENYQIGSSL